MSEASRAAGKPSELRLRVQSAVVLLAIVLAATWQGGLAFRAVWVAAGAVVLHEWSTIATAPRSSALRVLMWTAFAAVSAIVLFPALAAFAVWPADRLAVAAVVAGALVLGVAEWAGERRVWAAGGLVYAGLPPIAFAALRDGSGGFLAILFLFAVVFATDIFAYFVGRALKGPKLAPRISPGKTWSGSIGGAVAAVAAAAALASSTPILNAWAILAPALLLSVVSQMGDLGESAFKRHFGVKDSGRLIPGHGGVMDRIDALAVAAVALYLMAVAFGGAPGISG